MSQQFEIIDAHIHPPLGGEEPELDWYLPLQPPAEFFGALAGAGISRGCGGCVKRDEGRSFAATEECNRRAFELREQFPDFYIPAIQVHPRFPAESCRQVEAAHARGCRWVGELVGYFMGYDDYSTRGAFEIYDLCMRLGMTINFHAAEMNQISRMCRAFPRLNFVLAHPTVAKVKFIERLLLMEENPNLYLDLSGTGITRWGCVRYGADRVGAERLLFGTDFPICTPASFISCILAEPLDDRERAAIFAGNFKRLTGMA